MERISPHQFMILGAAVLMGTTFLPVAWIVTEASGRDGWMSVIPGFAVAIPYGLMVLSFLKQYPQKNLLQISETMFGKWIAKMIGILYISITAYFGGLLLAQIGDIYQASIMPLTPLGLFNIGVLLIVFYLVSSGIEVMARFCEVIFPLIAITLLLNLGLSIPRMEQGELLPILSEGFKPLLGGGLKVAPFAMEYILFLAVLLPFLPIGKQEFVQLKTGIWRAVFLVGFLNMLVTLMQIMVLGPQETIRLAYGLLLLGKMVEISRTVAGVESLFLGIWLGANIIKVAAFFVMAALGLETVFNLRGLKWRLAMAIVFLGIAFGFTRESYLLQEIALVDNYLILPFTSVWILILWGVSRWKKGTGV